VQLSIDMQTRSPPGFSLAVIPKQRADDQDAGAHRVVLGVNVRYQARPKAVCCMP